MIINELVKNFISTFILTSKCQTASYLDSAPLPWAFSVVYDFSATYKSLIILYYCVWKELVAISKSCKELYAYRYNKKKAFRLQKRVLPSKNKD